ncbi:MAG: AAA family ATPase [Chloroflexi bacterium]|nr:AAA family ATPase [Chloroflexota bacterium]
MPYPPLVQALLQPEAYPPPERPAKVEMVETHISYLFLTGVWVYKVKKPVDFGFLDFTTLDKRRFFCQEEVRLNRRLSPDVYQGVAEIRQSGSRYTIEGPGETVEYAVKMRQLPRSAAMSELLKAGHLEPNMVRRVAQRIWQFHRAAETSTHITEVGGIRAVLQNVAENFAQTERYIGLTLRQEEYDLFRAYSDAFLESQQTLFNRRAKEGRIRDCHGDLHTGQVFLENGISFLDCIEFNERFRYSDVASDLAFLAMDLDYHGHADLAQHFVESYMAQGGDHGLLDFLEFYKVYRAYVRGKVESFRLDEPGLPRSTRSQAEERARRYFALASSYARPPGPLLLITTGLMGTGKTTLALNLGGRIGAEVLSSDVVRKAARGVPSQEHHYEPWGQGLYTKEQVEETYRELLRQGGAALKMGKVVVLDASYRKAAWRRAAQELAEHAGAPFLVMECRCPEEAVRQRLVRRLATGETASDARWELYHQQKALYEPVRELNPQQHLVIDTALPPKEAVQQSLFSLYIALFQMLGPSLGATRQLSTSPTR